MGRGPAVDGVYSAADGDCGATDDDTDGARPEYIQAGGGEREYDGVYAYYVPGLGRIIHALYAERVLGDSGGCDCDDFRALVDIPADYWIRRVHRDGNRGRFRWTAAAVFPPCVVAIPLGVGEVGYSGGPAGGGRFMGGCSGIGYGHDEV